jgi:hypothetical protein
MVNGTLIIRRQTALGTDGASRPTEGRTTMKILLTTVIAGTFAAAAFHPAEKGFAPDADPIVTGAVGAPAAAPDGRGRYLIANAALGKVCFLTRGSALDGTSRIAADRACEGVWPGLSGATMLRENRDGTFSLQGRRGRPVLKLVAGDGIAFGAIEPQRALITISAAD